jgi:hypothetical protein
MSAADAWQQTGRPSDRSYPSARYEHDTAGGAGRRPARRTPPSVPGRAGERRQPADLAAREYASGEQRQARRPADPRSAAARPRERHAPANSGGGRLRGILAVLTVFLVTLAGAAADSFIGIGLGVITLVALVGSTILATLVVRRRDLVSVVVAPPLVFVAVAVADLAIAPSAHFSLTGMAPLLIKGFPAMGIATGAALVLCLIRRAAGR